jgi:hypothetical protein
MLTTHAIVSICLVEAGDTSGAVCSFFATMSLARVNEPVVSRVAVWKQIYLSQWFAKRRHNSGIPQR